MGVIIDMNKIQMTGSLNLFYNNETIGELRSAVYSPNFKVIGMAMIKPYFNVDQEFEINLIDKTNKILYRKLCKLPFI